MTFIDLNSEIRLKIITTVIVTVFLFLGFRLYQLQVVDSEKYTAASEKNAIKEKIIEPIRGTFYDRNWNLLVDDQPSYTLRITPKEFDGSLTPLIENYFKFSKGYIQSILKANRTYSPFIPIKILRGLNFKQISWLEENQNQLKGVDYSIDMKRVYPFGVSASHLFGYCKEISDKQLKENLEFYFPGDFVGHNGLEKYYEEYLRGSKGKKLVFVDAHGREISQVNEGKNDLAPIQGYDVQLSLDGELQKKAEELMFDKQGSIVALDPRNGEILAMLSKPDFDLTNFSSVTPIKVWNKLNNDKSKPLFNRATSAIYPPGSCFKMVSAIGALQDKVITPAYSYNCNGGFSYGNHFYKCMGVHGTVNVKTAIEKSCNTFFFSLILKMGFERWTKFGDMLGFGKKTNVDILEENKGILPSVDYYNRFYGVKKWTPGYIVSLGVGQGELAVTPLQMAVYVSAIANGGVLYRPHAVRKLFKPASQEKEIITKVDGKKLSIDKEVMDIVREGTFLVVNGAGTAGMVRIKDIHVAGKTGTAQNPHGEDHSWFVGYAPYENPTIAIAIIVENAGFGGAVAAPIAKQLIEFYLKKDKANDDFFASNKTQE
jgi:penicillin-binding protein 2